MENSTNINQNRFSFSTESKCRDRYLTYLKNFLAFPLWLKNGCHNPKYDIYTPERNKLMNRLVAAEFHLNFICLFACLFLTVLGLHCYMRVFSSCSKGGYSLLVVCWPRCGGFFSHGAWALGHVGCRLWWCMRLVAPWIWSLPRPGIEPVFPTFAGRLLTTGPPGKFHLNLDEQNSITWLLWAKRQVPVFSHLTVVMNKRNRMPVSVVNGYCLIIVYKVTF